MAGVIVAPISAWIIFRLKVAEKSATITGRQGKQKILVGIPRRHELHMPGTWLCLEPVCTQMKNEFVTSVRSHGTQQFPESREQPESQAHLGRASCLGSPCPVSPHSALCLYSPSISVGCYPTPEFRSHPSGLRALLPCIFEEFSKDEVFLAVAAGTQQICFSWDTSKQTKLM